MSTKTPGTEGVLTVRLTAITTDVGVAEQYGIGLLVASGAIEAAGGVALSG
jgi:hypothetical protein